MLPAGVYPQIIDPALFARVQDRLARNRRQSMRSDRNPEVGILRRGFVLCGHCGTRMVVAVSRGYTVYRCHTDGKRLFGQGNRILSGKVGEDFA